MTIFDEKTIRELFQQNGFIVEDIDLDNEEYMAYVNIKVNSIGIYSPEEIKNIVIKIKNMENQLVTQGFLHDVRFGDLFKGNWKILVHFLDEDEIEEWEKKIVKDLYDRKNYE